MQRLGDRGVHGSARVREGKAVTHEFEDLSSCPGSTPSALLHAELGSVALSSGGSQAKSFKTPIKVSHPADCADPSYMELQLPTTVTSLMVTESLVLANAALDLVDTFARNIWIRVTTGTVSMHSTADGFITAYSASWGQDGVRPLASDPDHDYNYGEEVVGATYIPRFRGLYLAGTNTNGWQGTAEYSLDNTNWLYLSCMDCSGEHHLGSRVYVDKDSAGTVLGATWCIGGASCLFVP